MVMFFVLLLSLSLESLLERECWDTTFGRCRDVAILSLRGLPLSDDGAKCSIEIERLVASD